MHSRKLLPWYGLCLCTTSILSHLWKIPKKLGMISLQRRCKKHRQNQLFSIRGLTFEKIIPEVLFYGTSERNFYALGGVPNSNSLKIRKACLWITNATHSLGSCRGVLCSFFVCLIGCPVNRCILGTMDLSDKQHDLLLVYNRSSFPSWYKQYITCPWSN